MYRSKVLKRRGCKNEDCISIPSATQSLIKSPIHPKLSKEPECVD